MKWVTVALLFAALYQCHETRELRSDLDNAEVDAINALNRANRVAADLETLEYDLRRR